MALDLAGLAPLVRIMATERTRSRPELFEDAAQEGLIAAWAASEKHPGQEPRYYHGAARNGVLNVTRGQPPTGAPSRRGWQDAHDSSHATPEGYDAPAPEVAGLEYEDVRAAVRGLEPDDQELVFRRYWAGEKDRDIAERLGAKLGTISWRWSKRIKPALREALVEYGAA